MSDDRPRIKLTWSPVDDAAWLERAASARVSTPATLPLGWTGYLRVQAELERTRVRARRPLGGGPPPARSCDPR